jgi:hypothetical protein
VSSIPPSGESSRRVTPVTPVSPTADRRANTDDRKPEHENQEGTNNREGDIVEQATPRSAFFTLQRIFEPTTYSPNDAKKRASAPDHLFTTVLNSEGVFTEEEIAKVHRWMELRDIQQSRREKIDGLLEPAPEKPHD